MQEAAVETMGPVINPLPTDPPNPYGWPADAIAWKSKAILGDLSAAPTDQFYTLLE